MPALMTPCSAKGEPDFDALSAKGKELVEAGMSAVVYCGDQQKYLDATAAEEEAEEETEE